MQRLFCRFYAPRVQLTVKSVVNENLVQEITENSDNRIVAKPEIVTEDTYCTTRRVRRVKPEDRLARRYEIRDARRALKEQELQQKGTPSETTDEETINEDEFSDVTTNCPDLESEEAARRTARKLRDSDRHLIDHHVLLARGGKAGFGCVAFMDAMRRSRRGFPSGGEGGRGGDVFIQADQNCTSLSHLAGQVKMEGEAGHSGANNGCRGKDGKDVIISVPLGTQITIHRSVILQEAEKAQWWNDWFSESPRRRNTTQLLAKSRRPTDRICQLFLTGLNFEEQQYETLGEHPHRPFCLVRAAIPDLKNNSKTRIAEQLEEARELVEHGFLNENGFELSLEEQAMNASTEPRTERLQFHLTVHGQRVRVAQGSLGHLGNQGYGLFNKLHEKYRPCLPPVRVDFTLARLADVALVGMPNAGKSSLLSAMTRAVAKVAPYPFTTLSPQVGVVCVDECGAAELQGEEHGALIYAEKWPKDLMLNATVTMLDVPGLIPGASRNVGLGHAFLRHAVRAHVALLVVDASRGDEAAKDCDRLVKILEEYDEQHSDTTSALSRVKCIVITKCDRNTAWQGLAAVQNWRNEKQPQWHVIPVSSHQKLGLNVLKAVLMRDIAMQDYLDKERVNQGYRSIAHPWQLGDKKGFLLLPRYLDATGGVS